MIFVGVILYVFVVDIDCIVIGFDYYDVVNYVVRCICVNGGFVYIGFDVWCVIDVEFDEIFVFWIGWEGVVVFYLGWESVGIVFIDVRRFGKCIYVEI